MICSAADELLVMLTLEPVEGYDVLTIGGSQHVDGVVSDLLV